MLAATGVFVYLRFEAELDATINAGLRSRADELSAQVREAEPGLAERGRLVGRSESFAEVVSPEGKVIDSSAAVGNRVLLTAEEIRRALREPLLIDRGNIPGLDRSSRLLAVSARSRQDPTVVVVGASTEDRNESLEDLLQLLLIGEPVALILASIAAYWVAVAALRPVEAMRVRAASISAAEPEERLPVPPTKDEIGRLGQTLNEMLARLHEAIEHERAFVADASHELRTPLAILRAELDLALAEGRTREELRAALSSAAEETDRLSQLAEDLLTIAQTEGGELPLRIATIQLGDVFESVKRRFERRVEEQGREIVVDGGGIAVEADRLRLEQVLGSVVDNAVRYGTGTIAITASRSGAAVVLAVADEGAGFPAEFLDRAFQRFSRASSSRGDGGSGLGLSIVRTVARAHGGEASARNRDGGGAEVTIALPDRGADAVAQLPLTQHLEPPSR